MALSRKPFTFLSSGEVINSSKDTVVSFYVATVGGGRRKAFDYFGQRFNMEYSEKEWNEDYIDHYPGGYVDL